MKRLLISFAFCAVMLVTSACDSKEHGVPVMRPTTDENVSWSATVNGLQARLTLAEKEPAVNGTRWLVPYLELRNVRNLANEMDVHCDRQHLKVELVDAEGAAIHEGESGNRSGPARAINTIILPMDRSMSISLECRNWGVPKSAAMVSTDSGAWSLKPNQNGKVYLLATLKEQKSEPEWKTWYGTIQTPLLKVDWK